MLDALVRRLQASDVSDFECEGPDVFVRLRFTRGTVVPAAALPAVVPGPDTQAVVLRSSSIGRLVLAHPLSDLAALAPGDRVEPGQLVGLLRVGDVLTPILADHGGTVERVIGEEGALLGYGDGVIALA